MNALLHEIKRTRIGHICETKTEDIVHRPDTQIEYWIKTNENLLRKFKKDTAQRTLCEFFRTMQNPTLEESEDKNKCKIRKCKILQRIKMRVTRTKKWGPKSEIHGLGLHTLVKFA